MSCYLTISRVFFLQPLEFNEVKDVNPGRNESSEAKAGDFVVFTWEGAPAVG